MSRSLGVASLVPGKKIDAAAEQVLLEQVRRQDLDAFSKIVDAYQARIFGFVKRMVRSDEDAMDISQEVFVRAFQAVERFDGRSGLRTWLFRIAHNLCVDRARRAERAPSFVSLEPSESEEGQRDFADARWNPEEVILREELREVVEEALASMSEKLRTVLLLHDKEDMGYEEISRTVDVPVGTVKSRLFLARAHLQQHVGRYLAKG